MRVEGGSGPRYRRSGSLPSSRGDPWETVKFEACGGARPLWVYCKLVVESRSSRAKRNSDNSDNLIKINKNMAKLGSENSASLISPNNFSDKFSSNEKSGTRTLDK